MNNKTAAEINFPGQRADENVKYILRRHPLTLLSALAFLFFLAVLPLALYVFFTSAAISAFREKPYTDIYFLMVTVYYGFLWIAAFMEWTDYYLDIWIITNQRILSVEQKGFFSRTASEVELDMIQDITSTVEGPLQTLFEFGDIEIQTASEKNKINPKLIPHPVTVRREIMDLCKAAQEKNRFVFKDENCV